MKNAIYISLLSILMWTSASSAQKPGDAINQQALNRKYLEHLIKIKIDSVRKEYDCKPLVNDSILYVASDHHARYMLGNSILTHYELEYEKFKTPQLRAKQYGAKGYLVGENCIKTVINKLVNQKNGKTISTGTYNGLSDAIVSGWVNSPGHFKNIITPTYEVTGLTVAWDKESGKIYSCQKFGTVPYKYSFPEPKSMFPYSDYVLEPVANSFEGIPNRQRICHHCPTVQNNDCDACDRYYAYDSIKPFSTLRIEKGNFILLVSNGNAVKTLLRNKYDGFAVEIVLFDDYMCGNPAYYTRPSRRNNQLKLNGILLKPVFRDRLYSGLKERSRKKNFEKWPYLLKADSVPLFKRHKLYRFDKINSKYFEIRLGRVPRKLNGLWNHNLVYIQDKQICDIDFLTGYCGRLYNDKRIPAPLFQGDTTNYGFKEEYEHFTFEVPFEKNKYEFTEDDIFPLLSTLNDLTFRIDSINMVAYSSIEGTKTINDRLQKKRAKSIAEVLQSNQTENIPIKIETDEAWDDFRSQLQYNRKWKHLDEHSDKDILKKLDEKTVRELEPLLVPGRKAVIDLYCTIPVDSNNWEYLIAKEYGKLYNLSENTGRQDTIAQLPILKQLERLYRYTYGKVLERKVDTFFLAGLPMPSAFELSSSLRERFMLIGHILPGAYELNDDWYAIKDEIRTKLFGWDSCGHSDEFMLLHGIVMENDLRSKEKIDLYDFEYIFQRINCISEEFANIPYVEENIKKLRFNLHMINLNKTFIKSRWMYMFDAMKAINYVHNYYDHRKMMDMELAMNLAKMAVFYHLNFLAIKILNPYMEHEEAQAYVMPLKFTHVSNDKTMKYYNELLRLSETMNEYLWCNMFINHCGIPFQVFDHEELRNVFCEKCQDKNEFIQQLLGE